MWKMAAANPSTRIRIFFCLQCEHSCCSDCMWEEIAANNKYYWILSVVAECQLECDSSTGSVIWVCEVHDRLQRKAKQRTADFSDTKTVFESKSLPHLVFLICM
jgi:hypothetical protein